MKLKKTTAKIKIFTHDIPNVVFKPYYYSGLITTRNYSIFGPEYICVNKSNQLESNKYHTQKMDFVNKKYWIVWTAGYNIKMGNKIPDDQKLPNLKGKFKRVHRLAHK